jgi:hypothetical protein
MRIAEVVTEAFNQPYGFKWEHGEFGDYDALTRLPDGTNLSIMFNNEDNEWQVEFYRNNSQEVTGEGDQQRVFATVLEAIRQFVKMEDPESIRFSANKEVEPGQKSLSRSNLYSSLVRRYANSMGYSAEENDFGHNTVYVLDKIR